MYMYIHIILCLYSYILKCTCYVYMCLSLVVSTVQELDTPDAPRIKQIEDMLSGMYMNILALYPGPTHKERRAWYLCGVMLHALHVMAFLCRPLTIKYWHLHQQWIHVHVHAHVPCTVYIYLWFHTNVEWQMRQIFVLQWSLRRMCVRACVRACVCVCMHPLLSIMLASSRLPVLLKMGSIMYMNQAEDSQLTRREYRLMLCSRSCNMLCCVYL